MTRLTTSSRQGPVTEPAAEPVALYAATADAEKGETEQREANITFFESIALPLLARGFEVAPCYPRDKKVHTRLVPSPLTMKSKDPAKIHEWGQAEPNANVCVYAEQREGGLLFLDKDGAISLIEKYERETGKKFPRTLLVQSSTADNGVPKGHWYFYQTPRTIALGGNIPESKTGGLFSLRVNHYYVTSIGSIHPKTGLPYAVADDAAVTPMPDSFLDWLLAQVKDEQTTATTTPSGERRLIPHGQLHGAYMAEAGRLWNAGYSTERVIEMTVEWTHLNGEPPIDDAKVRKEALDLTQRYKQGEWTGLVLSQSNQPTPEEAQQAAAIIPPLTTTKGDDFLRENIAPRKVLISTITGCEPAIFEQSINQVFAWRGAGKTCLGLGFVRCLATGEPFLNFKSNCEPVPVLYVEGELPDSQFQERWRSIVGDTNGMAYLASIDKQPNHHFESMATTEGMQKVENTLADLQKRGVNIKVLLLDNISTLFNAKANEEETWIPIQSWFTSLRSRGLTVFFFHHAGKQGLSRSHSKSEDMLDISIKLEEPDEPEVGHLHSLMSFDKARAGLSERAAEIKLHRTHSPRCICHGNPGVLYCPGDGVRWEHIPKANMRDEAYKLFAEGKSVQEVKLTLDVALGTVKTWRVKWGREIGIEEKTPKPN